MIMTVSEACNVLHVDEGANDELISSLVEAIPDYIEVATGFPVTEQAGEPLIKVVAGFLLTQWYYADHADDQALTRTINALLKSITIKAREYASETESVNL